MTNGEKIRVLLKPREDQIKIYGDWVEIEIQSLAINFSCSLEWWNAEYKESVIRDNGVKDELEPTTKSDVPENNVGKIEPTTKNNLGVDCISRIEVIDYLCKHCPDDGECFKDCDEIKHLRQMPSVTPQEPKIVSIAEIKYDKDKLKELVDKAVLTVTPQEPILDKIRAEIEQTVSRYSISRERGGMGQVEWSDRLIKESEVLQILDKYKGRKVRIHE